MTDFTKSPLGVPEDYLPRKKDIQGDITYYGYSKRGIVASSESWYVIKVDSNITSEDFVLIGNGSWVNRLNLNYN